MGGGALLQLYYDITNVPFDWLPQAPPDSQLICFETTKVPDLYINLHCKNACFNKYFTLVMRLDKLFFFYLKNNIGLICLAPLSDLERSYNSSSLAI